MKRILAIDTSCDETSIAVVEKTKAGRLTIKSSIVSSQVKLHQKDGGVYPALAKREHQRNLLPVLIKTLKQAKLFKITNLKLQIPNKYQISNNKLEKIKQILEREPKMAENLLGFFKKCRKPRLRPAGYGGQAKIEAIAVTVGPGLEPCLWAGINFAKALSFFWGLPVIPVNHLEAHLLVNFLAKKEADIGYQKTNLPAGRPGLNSRLAGLPAIGLVVSGGNTQLILIKKIGRYQILGETRDDAAGECLDKAARILGLSYPGGPTIEKEAAKILNPKSQILNKFEIQNSKFEIKLPRPMINSRNYDFSFSGLKTAVLYDYKKRPLEMRRSEQYIKAMAKEIQQSIVDVLIKKTIGAAKQFKVKTIILGGGVACNKELQKQFKQRVEKDKLGFTFHVPSSKLCLDNAAMIGAAAFFHLKNKVKWQNIEAKPNLKL